MASDPWRREEEKVLDSRRPMAGAGGPLRLRDWLVAQIESGRYAGLRWEDAGKTLFRIPWKHAAKHGYQAQQDAALFRVRGPRPAAGRRSGPAREASGCVWPLASVISRLRVMFSVYERPSDTLLNQNLRCFMTCTSGSLSSLSKEKLEATNGNSLNFPLQNRDPRDIFCAFQYQIFSGTPPESPCRFP